MSAWLKRLDLTALTAERWLLPRSGLVRIGRDSDATFRLPAGADLPACDLVAHGSRWLFNSRDPSSPAKLGSKLVTSLTALESGDVIDLGDTLLVFNPREEDRNDKLEEAIVADPDDPGPWGVYADWLLERGDPLGERIVNGSNESAAWLEGLAHEAATGQLELVWAHGFVQKAVLRAVPGQRPQPWTRMVAQLLSLRVCRFLRELVVDLPALSQLSGDDLYVLFSHPAFERLPWPATLDRLSFGYHEARPGEREHLAWAEKRLRVRLPWLTGPIFLSAKTASAEMIQSQGVVSSSRVALGDCSYLVRDGQRFFFQNSEPLAGGLRTLIARFEKSRGRWRLTLAQNESHGVTANGFPITDTWDLLPGDEIKVLPGLKLRFTVYG
jgi:uncharacterized protein (TIGR02996 family)